MIWTRHQLTFLTPCYCAGADMKKAEIRAASIRGQLRWWFRVLGGDRDLEGELFGSVHMKLRSSALMLRVTEDERGTDAPRLPKNQQGFLGNREGGCLSQGSMVTLHLRLRKELSSQAQEGYCRCLDTFLQLGSVGARITRGCGAFAVDDQVMDRDSFLRWSGSLPNVDVYSMQPVKTPLRAHGILEEKLGEFRSWAGLSKEEPDALGHAEGNTRHSSCLHLRPVQIHGGILPVMFYTDHAKAESIDSIRDKLRRWFA